MKFLVSGATGLIGQHICAVLRAQGHTINYLTTNRDKIEHTPEYQGYFWNPTTGEIDVDCLKDVDKIIHLAGASIAKRWTKKRKKEIIASRIQSARLLFEFLEKTDNQVTQFLSASAIGIYPSSLSNLYDEFSTECASDFLGLVVKEWEAEADRFKTIGVEVTKVRIGLVLANESGFLAEMKRVVGLGLGASLGSGSQWQSWIHISDLARLFVYLAEEELAGLYNAVAPNPTKQKRLLKCLAKELHVSFFLPPIPKSALKIVLGDMANMVTSSQLVMSKRLQGTDFTFEYKHAEKAIKNLVRTT